MKRLSVILAAACTVAFVFQGPGLAEEPADGDRNAMMRHLKTAMVQMDRGPRSSDYRESLRFLRSHADEVASRVSSVLLDEPGSFRKWQVAYLIGELGNESAIVLLRAVLDEPMPVPQVLRASEHEIDLQYAEELTSRIQAVMSIARIAVHRPALRDQVVVTLLEVAREVPMAKSTALFELRKLLGPEVETIRGRLDPEDAKHLDGFVPPPEWQALLSRRTAKHDRRQREIRETREPLCRRN